MPVAAAATRPEASRPSAPRPAAVEPDQPPQLNRVPSPGLRPPEAAPPPDSAPALRLLAAPCSEPPWDDDVVIPLPVRPEPMPGSLTLPFPRPPRTVPRPALRLVPAPEGDSTGPRNDAPDALAPVLRLPSVRCWAETTAMAIAQVLTGERPPGPLRSAVVPEVYDLLSRKAALATRSPRGRAFLRAVHVCCPAPGIAEVSTVLHGVPNPRALAFRLEARRTRWICTVLELG